MRVLSQIISKSMKSSKVCALNANEVKLPKKINN